MDPSTKTMIENLEKNTGKKLHYWTGLVKDSNLDKHGALVKMLKEDHGLGHGYANLVVHLANQSAATSQEDTVLIDGQYEKKENLREIYDLLAAKIIDFGTDVEVAPKKKSVSFRRNRQFALIQPSTRTRIDLGLKFDNRPHSGRLETSGPFGTMCSHRVQITDISQVDNELISFIRDAYNEAG